MKSCAGYTSDHLITWNLKDNNIGWCVAKGQGVIWKCWKLCHFWTQPSSRMQNASSSCIFAMRLQCLIRLWKHNWALLDQLSGIKLQSSIHMSSHGRQDTVILGLWAFSSVSSASSAYSKTREDDSEVTKTTQSTRPYQYSCLDITQVLYLYVQVWWWNFMLGVFQHHSLHFFCSCLQRPT